MELGLITRIWTRDKRSAKGVRTKQALAYYRPRVRGFEERVVPSTFGGAALAPAHVGSVHLNPLTANQAVNVLPLRITGVDVQNGALVATGKLGSHTFTAPLTLTASPNAADPTCPILNLQVAPIHLNLLGLHVDTSAICLSITAQSGSGNLLGNLLCDVANLLNQGTPLDSILSGLSADQLTTLTSGASSMLNTVLHDVTTPAIGSIRQDVSVASTPGARCNVLNLSLGPVDLTLLGLNVHLDNCANGPVKVSVTAQPGAGNLLGNLLCNLSHLLDSNAAGSALENALGRVAGAIQALI